MTEISSPTNNADDKARVLMKLIDRMGFCISTSIAEPKIQRRVIRICEVARLVYNAKNDTESARAMRESENT